MPESSNRKTLVDQCWTHWIARHDPFHVFEKLYVAIQSNLDYPNPFGQGEFFERSDEQKVRITLTTPTNSIVHVKVYI
jgi:hypothetical protein